MRIRSHCEMFLHLTWATHNRSGMITPEREPLVHQTIDARIRDLDCLPMAINGVADHVHVLLRMKGRLSPSSIAGDLKGGTSYEVNRAYPQHRLQWQRGYGGFTVSPHKVDTVARYIRGQKQHHAQNTTRSYWEL